GETELAQEPLQALFAAIQIGVVTDSRQQADLHARLLRIDLPRMQIERERHAVPLVDPPQAGAHEAVREQPEVAAARDRNGDAAEQGGGHRELDDLAAGGRLHRAGRARRAGHAIAVMAHREDGRVVLEPEVDQGIQRPARLRRYGKTRRSITAYGLADEIFEQLFGVAGLVPERLLGLRIDQLV